MDFKDILQGFMQANDQLSNSEFFVRLIQEAKPLSEADVPYLKNWLLVSERLTHDTSDYQIVLSMLAYELAHMQRGQVISRLISRFVNIVKRKAHDNFAKSLSQSLWSASGKAVRLDEKA
jgi:hypothetical protein